MHILDSYLVDFQTAMENRNFGRAVDEIHAMIQRDPVDAKDHISRALKRLLAQEASRPKVPPEAPATEEAWIDFLDRSDALGVGELEDEVGRELQSFVTSPTLESLERIKKLTRRMQNKGLLERYETELPDGGGALEQTSGARELDLRTSSPEIGPPRTSSITGWHVREHIQRFLRSRKKQE